MKSMYALTAAAAVIALTAITPASAQGITRVGTSDAIELIITDSTGATVFDSGVVLSTEISAGGVLLDTPNPVVVASPFALPNLTQFVSDPPANSLVPLQISDMFGTCNGTNAAICALTNPDVTNGVFLWSDPIGETTTTFQFAEISTCPGGTPLNGGTSCLWTFTTTLSNGDTARLLAVSDVDIPGPLLGAGVPGMVLAFGGLLAWWRRRPKTT